MPTRVARPGSWVVLAGLVAGLCCLSTPAAAARAYVCEHPLGGSCEVARTGTVECECGGQSYASEVEGLETATDAELGDACWAAYSEHCNDESVNAECEAPDRGRCDATTAEGGRIECECADGRTANELDRSDLEDLDEDELEQQCYEELDQLCEPLPPTTPVMLPPPVEPAPASTSCRTGEGGPGAAGLVGLASLLWGFRRRRRP